MPAAPFSIRLAPALKARLHNEAERAERSLGFVAQKAIGAYLDALDDKRAAIVAAITRADQGHLIPAEHLHAWVASWGADSELPPPKATKART